MHIAQEGNTKVCKGDTLRIFTPNRIVVCNRSICAAKVNAEVCVSKFAGVTEAVPWHTGTTTL